MIGRMPFVAITCFKLLQIQLLHRTMHEKAKMPFSQHFSHGWWQQVSVLRVVLQKSGHPVLLSWQYRGSVKPSCHTDSCTPLLGVRTFRPATASTRFQAIPFVLIFLRTLLHVPKTQLFCVQAIPHSLCKNTRGGGEGGRQRYRPGASLTE